MRAVPQRGGGVLVEVRGVLVVHGRGVLTDLLPPYLVVVGVDVCHADDVG